MKTVIKRFQLIAGNYFFVSEKLLESTTKSYVFYFKDKNCGCLTRESITKMQKYKLGSVDGYLVNLHVLLNLQNRTETIPTKRKTEDDSEEMAEMAIREEDQKGKHFTKKLRDKDRSIRLSLSYAQDHLDEFEDKLDQFSCFDLCLNIIRGDLNEIERKDCDIKEVQFLYCMKQIVCISVFDSELSMAKIKKFILPHLFDTYNQWIIDQFRQSNRDTKYIVKWIKKNHPDIEFKKVFDIEEVSVNQEIYKIYKRQSKSLLSNKYGLSIKDEDYVFTLPSKDLLNLGGLIYNIDGFAIVTIHDYFLYFTREFFFVALSVGLGYDIREASSSEKLKSDLSRKYENVFNFEGSNYVKDLLAKEINTLVPKSGYEGEKKKCACFKKNKEQTNSNIRSVTDIEDLQFAGQPLCAFLNTELLGETEIDINNKLSVLLDNQYRKRNHITNMRRINYASYLWNVIEYDEGSEVSISNSKGIIEAYLRKNYSKNSGNSVEKLIKESRPSSNRLKQKPLGVSCSAFLGDNWKDKEDGCPWNYLNEEKLKMLLEIKFQKAFQNKKESGEIDRLVDECMSAFQRTLGGNYFKAKAGCMKEYEITTGKKLNHLLYPSCYTLQYLNS